MIYYNIKKLRLLHPCYLLGVTSKERLWAVSPLLPPNSYLLLMLLYIYIPIVIYIKTRARERIITKLKNSQFPKVLEYDVTLVTS